MEVAANPNPNPNPDPNTDPNATLNPNPNPNRDQVAASAMELARVRSWLGIGIGLGLGSGLANPNPNPNQVRAWGRALLVWPEDRRYPIRMSHTLPLRWVRAGAAPPNASVLQGDARRGEWFAFQLG